MLATEALWLGSAEGVRVTFDRRRTAFARLCAHAARTGCDRFVYTTTEAQQQVAAAKFGDRAKPATTIPAGSLRADGEPQYYLRRTPLRFVPMTVTQATRLNAAMGAGRLTKKSVRRWLSPRQIAWLELVQAKPDAGWPVAHRVEIGAARRAFAKVADSLR